MKTETFNKFRRLVHETSGISLGPEKTALVTSRISKRMKALNIDSHEEYLKHVTEDMVRDEVIHMIDAISTNVTSFYREAYQFDFLSDLIAKKLDNGIGRLRIWSAASSTGEEPYTLAITLLEALTDKAVDARILATDISTKALSLAQRGRYEEKKIMTVPRALQLAYFDKHKENGQIYYTVKDKLRRLIKFTRLNLSHHPFPMRGSLDAIFCRNVMIYFDNALRIKLVKEFHRLLNPGGHLFVGSSEGMVGMISDFKLVKPSIYVKQ